MPTSDSAAHAEEHSCNPAVAPASCDLFGDGVADHVCLLLNKELNDWWKCDVFCSGCNRR